MNFKFLRLVNIVAFAVVFLFPSISFAQVLRADVDPLSPGNEYVVADPTGGIHLFDAVKSLPFSSKDVVIGNIPVQEGNRIVRFPLNLSVLGKSWLLFPVEGNGKTHIYSIISGSTGIEVASSVLELNGKYLAGVSDSCALIVNYEGLFRISSASGKLEASSVKISGFPYPHTDIIELESLEPGKYLVGYKNGSVHKVVLNGMTLTDAGEIAPAYSINQSFDGISWSDAEKKDVVAWNKNGKYRVYSNGVWSSEDSLQFAPLDLSIASTESGVKITVLRSSGGILNINPDGSKYYSLRAASEFSGFVRSSNGHRNREDASTAPSSFGAIGGLFNKILGFFHHPSDFGVSEYKVDPARIRPGIESQKSLIRYSVLGRSNAKTKVVITRDTTLTDKFNNLQDWSAATVGRTDLFWNGKFSGIDSTRGQWWSGLFVANDADTLRLWKSIQVDDTIPSPLSDFEYEGTVSIVSGKNLKVGGSRHLILDVGMVKDLPWSDSALHYTLNLVNTKTVETFAFRFNSGKRFIFDGSDDAGNPLPNGEYSISLKSEDFVGNVISKNSNFVANGSNGLLNFDHIVISRFRDNLNVEFRPLLIEEVNRYRGELNIQIDGTPLGNRSFQLIAPDGTNIKIGPNGTNLESFILDNEGKWSYKTRLDLIPGQYGIQKGRNLLQAVLLNSDGDTVSSEIPVIVDKMETLITSPTESQAFYDSIAVYGVAIDPSLATGQTAYRVLWAKGNYAIGNGLSLDSIMRIAAWKAGKVPFSRQTKKLPSWMMPLSSDGLYPNSNIGVEGRAESGLLGWISPLPEDTGAVTVLVLTTSKSSTGIRISYDSKRIRHLVGRTKHVNVSSLIVYDSTNILYPKQTLGMLDLTNSNKNDDSLIYGFESSYGRLVSELTVVHGRLDENSTLNQVLRERLQIDSGKVTRWAFHGLDYSGAPLDTGLYTLIIESSPSPEGIPVRRAIELRVLHPALRKNNTALSIAPSQLIYDPTLGVRPKVEIRVIFDQIQSFRIRILPAGWHDTSSIIFAASVTGRNFKSNWDFKSLGADLLATTGIRDFDVILEPLSSSSPWSKEIARIHLNEGLKSLDTSMSMLTIRAEDSLIADSATNDFKFKIKAKGVLNYFPDRRIRYGAFVTGDQVIRNFLSVPWGIDYLKFYNSVEILTSGTYTLHGYTSWPHSGGWSRSANAPLQYKSLYALRSDRSWYYNSLNIDSVKDDWKKLRVEIKNPVAVSKLPTKPVFFGDNAWIGISVPELYKEDARRKIEFDIRNNLPSRSDFESAAKAATLGKHSCNFIQSINVSNDEDASNWCNVASKSDVITIPDYSGDDYFKSTENGSISFTYVKPQSDKKSSSQSSLFYSMNGLSNENGIENISHRGPVRFLDSKVGTGISPHYPGHHVYWCLRDQTAWNTSSNNSLRRNWEDDDPQRAFVELPYLHWEHPHLMAHGRREDSLNYAFEQERDTELRVDPVSWDQEQSLQNWNCFQYTDSDKDSCYLSFGGSKQGIRGFSIYPSIDPLITKDGRNVPQYVYIKNFFDRNHGEGMVSWKNPQWDNANTDDLEFRPKLDVSDAMMGITWDTVSIPFPYGIRDAKLARTFEKNQKNDSILAWTSSDSLNVFPMLQDTAKFPLLSYRENTTSKINSAGPENIDSVDVPLDQIFSRLLARTDSGYKSAGNPKLYGYIHRKGLKWQLPLFSYRVDQDGWTLEPDSTNLYHTVSYFDSPIDGTVKARVYYRNRPTVLGNWSSEMDSTFAKTKGWIYGSNRFNKNGFQDRNPGAESGFLSLVNPRSLSAASPRSIAPFVLKNDSVKLNSNIDLKNFEWIKEVYYADGSTPNSDVGEITQESGVNNFQVGLKLDQSSKSFLPIRGVIPSKITQNGMPWAFHSFRVYGRAFNDSSTFVNLDVNRFFRSESSSIDVGDLIPNSNLDFWERNTIPALAWWDVSSRIGRQEVLLVVEYKNANGEIRAVKQRARVDIGKVVAQGQEIKLDAPYGRATLQMDSGLTAAGTALSINTVATTDLKLGANMPLLAPVGPVIKIQTNGSRTFPEGKLPELSYRLTAREIFELENNSKFETSTVQQIKDFLTQVLPAYKIYVLSEAGTLDPAPTIYSYANDNTQEKDKLVIVLQARLPHFSHAMLLRDDGHNGDLPAIDSVSVHGNKILFKGRYSSRKNLNGLVAIDLQLWLKSDTLATGNYSGPISLSVDQNGNFSDSVTASEGWNSIVIRYAGSNSGVRKSVYIEPSILNTWDWSSTPINLLPDCGKSIQHILFTTNRSGTASWTIQLPTGSVGSVRSFSYTRGKNEITWDGCVDGVPMTEGIGAHWFSFGSDSSLDRRVRFVVGSKYLNGLRGLFASSQSYVPSPTDPSKQLILRLAFKGVPFSDIKMNLVRNATGDVVYPVASDITDSSAIYSWNGLKNSAAYTGDWIVSATRLSDPLDRLETHVRVLEATSPQIHLSMFPQVLRFPVYQSELRLESKLPLSVESWLESIDGHRTHQLSSLFNRQRISSGNTSWSWSFQDSSKASIIPSRWVVRWVTDENFQGLDTLAFEIDTKPDSLGKAIIFPLDTIYPDFPQSMRILGDRKLDDIARFDFSSRGEGRLEVSWHNSRGSLVRCDTLKIKAGANSWIWDARDNDSLLVPEGSYHWTVRILPVIPSGATRIAGEGPLQVVRMPDLVLSVDQDQSKTSIFSKDPAFVKQLQQRLNQRGISSVRVMNAEGTAAYMAAKPHGVVAFTDVLLNDALYNGTPWNSVFRFVRAGGKTGFVGGLPLSHAWFNGGKVTTTASTMVLLGLGNPYASDSTLIRISNSSLKDNLGILDIDSAQQDLLTLARQRLVSDTLPSMAVRQDSLIKHGQWVSLVRHRGIDTINEPKNIRIDTVQYLSSFFGTPQLWGGNPDSNGSVLVVAPYLAERHADSLPDLASGYGDLLYRYFFAEDLYLSPREQKLDTSHRILRGDILKLSSRLRYLGEHGLDSAVLRMRDGVSIGLDSIRVNHNLNRFVLSDNQWNFPVPSDAPFGHHELIVSVDRFSRYDTSKQDSIREENPYNNIVRIPFTVADDHLPVLAFLDTLDNGKLLPALSPNLEAHAGSLRGIASTKHTVGDIELRAGIVKALQDTIMLWTGTVPAGDQQAFEVPLYSDSTLRNGDVLKAFVIGKDIFGNISVLKKDIHVDSIRPTINSLEIVDAARDSTGRLFTLTSNNAYKIHLDTRDQGVIRSIELFRSTGKENEGLSVGDSLVKKCNLTQHDSVWVENNQSKLIRVRLTDWAGNWLEREISVISDEYAPWIRAWTVTKTLMDSAVKNPGLLSLDLSKHSLLLKPAKVNDTSTARIDYLLFDSQFATAIGSVASPEQNKNASWSVTIPTQVGREHNILFDVFDDAFAKREIRLDGHLLTSLDSQPYLKEGSPKYLPKVEWRNQVEHHPRQVLVSIKTNRPYHVLEVTARDSIGHVSQAVVYFESPEADFQVVDSALDNGGTGADWGKVWMRRNDTTLTALAQPQTWTYWLIERRNPLSSISGLPESYTLAVDVDNDSTTGVGEGKTRGADIALKFNVQNTGDVGTSVLAQKLHWDKTTGSWVNETAFLPEGVHALEGYSINGNQQDDLTTDARGEGDQLLPDGRVAKTDLGVLEIGMRLSASRDLRAPIRWILLPEANSSDTIRDSLGGMLLFQPYRRRFVDVDGKTQDWLSKEPAVQPLEIRSVDRVLRDSLKVKIDLRNPGVVPVEGFVLKYFLRANSAPTAQLDSVPKSWKGRMVLEGPTLSRRFGSDVWAVTIRCGDCVLAGGLVVPSAALIRVVGSGVRLVEDDWSHSTDTNAPNPRIPQYNAVTGALIGGEEPPLVSMRLPSIAIEQLPKNSWLRPGEKRVLKAVVMDPENRPLKVEWFHEGLGTSAMGLLDTVHFERVGVWRVRAKVSDSLAPERSAYAFVDLVVVDGAGNSGQKPSVLATKYLFDDSWKVSGAIYSMNSGVMLERSSDSLRDARGKRAIVLPARGTKLLSVPLDSLGFGVAKILCNDNLGFSATHNCNPELDYSGFTNLEFKVAMDADRPEPIRIWMDKTVYGQGNNVWEEDYVYLNQYMAKGTRSDAWQLVSIPLSELVTEKERGSAALALKFMSDNYPKTSARSRRVLLDDLCLVSYAKPADAIVTTRTASVALVGDPDPIWSYKTVDNHIGMQARFINQGSQPLHLDSMRVRFFYDSPEFMQDGAIRYGSDKGEYTHHGQFPADSTLDRNLLIGAASVSLDPMVSRFERASRSLVVNWKKNVLAAASGLTMRPSASFSAWYQVGHYDACVVGPNYCSSTQNSFTLHDGVRSMHWSWPRPILSYQFLDGALVEHQKSDGTWARLWGVAPGEDPLAVEYWARENLISPTGALQTRLPVARISVRGESRKGFHDTLDASGSYDPEGSALSFQWLDATGAVLSDSPVLDTAWDKTGSVVARVRVFDADRPWRYAVDSVALDVRLASEDVKAKESVSLFDDALNTLWNKEWQWPSWSKGSRTVTEIAFDSTCLAGSARLRAAEGSTFLEVPFRSQSDLLGTQWVYFEQEPLSFLDRYTNLEFWVASERKDSKLPLRIWITQQRQPSAGNTNNTNEEDFLFLQSYLPEGKLTQHWQKVSIPLAEVLRKEGGYLTAPDRLFLKIQADNSIGFVDNAWRENVFLDGIRLVRYEVPAGQLVTTRRSPLQVAIQNEVSNENPYVMNLTLRLLNAQSRAVRLDSLRLRLHQWAPATVLGSWRPLENYVGLDESVNPDVYKATVTQATTESYGPDALGLRANRYIEVDWKTASLSLPSRRGFSAFFQLQTKQPMPVYQNGKSVAWAYPDWTQGYQIASHVVLDAKQPDGSWTRIWGMSPGETVAPEFVGEKELLRPEAPTQAPASSYLGGGISCTSTDPGTGTGSASTGLVNPSDPTGWIVEPRNSGVLQTEPVQAGGQPSIAIVVPPGTEVDPWLVAPKFVFDANWKAAGKVGVRVWLDPAFYGAQSYFETIRLAMQGTMHYVALTPVGSADLKEALGTWKEYVFSYDPSSMDLGESFGLRIYLNALNGSQQRLYNLGGIRLIGSATTGGSTSTDPGTTTGSGSQTGTGSGTQTGTTAPVQTNFATTGVVTLQPGVTAQQVTASTGETVLALETFGGAPQMTISGTVDATMKSNSTIELRIKPDGLALQGWEYAQVILVDPASGRYWDALSSPSGSQQVSLGSGSDWRTLQFKYDSSLYQLGSTYELRLIFNANGGSANSRLLLDNLRYVP